MICSLARQSCRCPRASIMARFRRWAPWLPLKIKSVNFASGPRSRAILCRRILCLIGFPVRMDFCRGKCRPEPAKEIKARSTTRPRIRLLSPGKAFCSWIAVRYPMAQAVKTTGPEAYPPTPSTMSGPKERIKRQDWKRHCGRAINPLTFPQKGLPFRLTASIVLKV